MELVSIITPLFNRAHLLKETWESIKGQTYTHWEWIVVDDGSTDASFSIIDEIAQVDKRVRLYTRPHELRKGPSACRNYGVKISKGEYLLFLDSDDLLERNCLKHRVSMMLENTQLDFAVFSMQYFQQIPGDRQNIFNRFLDSKEEYLEYFLTDTPPWQTMCPIWKKDSFKRLGGFNEHYLCMEDPELHIRALISNYKFEVAQGTPDCFYRDSFKENQENNNFWKNSIEGRIKFLMDIYNYLDESVKNENEKHLYFSYLSGFYLSFIKGFMFARLDNNQKEFIALKNWARKRGIVTLRQYMLINIAQKVYASKSKLIDYLHLRGLVYRLI